MSPVAAAEAATSLTDTLWSNLVQTVRNTVNGAQQASCTSYLVWDIFVNGDLTELATQCRVVLVVDVDGMQARGDTAESSQPGASERLVQHLRRS